MGSGLPALLDTPQDRLEAVLKDNGYLRRSARLCGPILTRGGKAPGSSVFVHYIPGSDSALAGQAPRVVVAKTWEKERDADIQDEIEVAKYLQAAPPPGVLVPKWEWGPIERGILVSPGAWTHAEGDIQMVEDRLRELLPKDPDHCARLLSEVVCHVRKFHCISPAAGASGALEFPWVSRVVEMEPRPSRFTLDNPRKFANRYDSTIWNLQEHGAPEDLLKGCQNERVRIAPNGCKKTCVHGDLNFSNLLLDVLAGGRHGSMFLIDVATFIPEAPEALDLVHRGVRACSSISGSIMRSWGSVESCSSTRRGNRRV